METNLGQQTPKLNVTNVSSAVFGKEGSALGKESNIGKLSRILRTTRLKVNEVEKIIGKQENNIVINAEKIKVTGSKFEDKKYYTHSLYPGGLKTRTFRELNETRPEKIIEEAVKGMLPKNKLGKQMFKKLKVFSGSEHEHESQQPQVWEPKI